MVCVIWGLLFTVYGLWFMVNSMPINIGKFKEHKKEIKNSQTHHKLMSWHLNECHFLR